MDDLGIALSGGGSRAIAFHRGTLRALDELGVASRIEVVSTVSGGSVFGAAWMCAAASDTPLDRFLASLVPVLERGFVWPALLSPKALKVIFPGHTRTHRLAETFDELLTGRRKLRELPERPRLCLNATALNHGAVARFSRDGLSCDGVGERERSGSYPMHEIEWLTVGWAAAASAAFPFGLPPLSLAARHLPPLSGSIRGHRQIVLTDGGVLENLGVQTLLRSRRFGTRHIIVSDAGTAEKAWEPSLVGRVLSFGAFALTHDTLFRLLMVMNDKQNKSMRQIAMREFGAMDLPDSGRSLWFVRIDQTWDRFVRGIPQLRRREIAGPDSVPAEDAPAEAVEEFLRDHGVRLDEARERYREMGGDSGAKRANDVATQFTGLARLDIDVLADHASWQVHACHAVYGSFAATKELALP